MKNSNLLEVFAMIDKYFDEIIESNKSDKCFIANKDGEDRSDYCETIDTIRKELKFRLEELKSKLSEGKTRR